MINSYLDKVPPRDRKPPYHDDDMVYDASMDLMDWDDPLYQNVANFHEFISDYVSTYSYDSEDEELCDTNQIQLEQDLEKQEEYYHELAKKKYPKEF